MSDRASLKDKSKRKRRNWFPQITLGFQDACDFISAGYLYVSEEEGNTRHKLVREKFNKMVTDTLRRVERSKRRKK